MAKRRRPKKVWFYFDKNTKQIWALNFLKKSEIQYMAARSLWHDSYMWESTFFMMQALENLIKALYIQSTRHKIGINFANGDFTFTVNGGASGAPHLYRHSLDPYISQIEIAHPGFRKQIRTYFKEPGRRKGKNLLPTYFEKYQQGSRYPQKKNISIPIDIVHVFDEMFYKIRAYFTFSGNSEKIQSPLQTLIEDIPDPSYPHEFYRDYLEIGEYEKVFKKNKKFKLAPSLQP